MPLSARCTSRISPASFVTTAPTATLGVTYPATPSPTPFIHSSTKCSASKPSSAWAATRMSPATASTSSNRSRSYRLSVKPSPVRAMPERVSDQRMRS